MATTVELVNQAIADFSGRTIVETAEIVDALLDIRNTLTAPPEPPADAVWTEDDAKLWDAQYVPTEGSAQ